MPHRNRVLVIDDKRNDGESIVRKLWNLQIPSFFLHYESSIIESLSPDKQFDGIRLIFQDIELISSEGVPSEKNYSAAAFALNQVLSDSNGPWLMVAWSTWGEDPDEGDKYAKELYDHLVDRLPPGKRPYSFVVIDKTPYTTELHGEVKLDRYISPEDHDSLLGSVSQAVEELLAIESLSNWESNIRASASKVVSKLWQMIDIDTPEDRDNALSGILYQLARAQGGKRIKKEDDLSGPLYQILASLLYDNVSHMEAKTIIISEEAKQKPQASVINKMLHWEGVKSVQEFSPGCVYEWPSGPSEISFGNIDVSSDNLKGFIIDAFVKNDLNKIREANSDDDFLSNVSLVIMDITPACDYAQDKAFWRRFIVGVKVGADSKKHFYTNGGKSLAGEHLKKTPDFRCEDTDSNWHFIFNSSLIVSLNDKHEYSDAESEMPFTPDVRKLDLVGRIREQLLQEISTWFGSWASRPGIVYLD